MEEVDNHNDTLNSSFMAESMFELLNGNEGNQVNNYEEKPKT